MTAPRKFRGFANRTWHEGRGVDVLLGQLDEMVGVIGLVFITAYFRADVSGTWQLPPKLRDSWRSARTASSVSRWFSGARMSIRS